MQGNLPCGRCHTWLRSQDFEKPPPVSFAGDDVAYWTLTRLARRQLEQAFDARTDLRKGLSTNEKAFVRGLVDTFLSASRRLAGVMNEGAAVDPSMTYDLEATRAEVLVVHARDDRLNPFAVGEAIAARVSLCSRPADIFCWDTMRHFARP